MLVEQGAVLDREFRVRFEQAVLQFDVVDFVWLRFKCDHRKILPALILTFSHGEKGSAAKQ